MSSFARREFIRFVAASPLFAAGGAPFLAPAAEASEAGDVIAATDEAVNVFDFHATAREKLPPAHYGYLATGTEGDETLRANREGFRKFQLRARRLAGAETVDASIDLMGAKWPWPIALSPAGNQKAFHPLGEAAVARAAAKTSTLQILSTVATTSVEEVTRERGAPVWYQLYADGEWAITKAMLDRAERAGCPVVAWTVDMLGGSDREQLKRFSRVDTRDCTLCHDRSSRASSVRRKPMFDGLDLSRSQSSAGLSWDYVHRLKDATSMKLFIKGIVTGPDAELCLEHGVDGIVVSNHGGRAEASGRGTIECLEEVVDAVGGRIPVLIDSGFRRGVDIFKALALGADAVCVGRPYLWGLAAFGQEGVEAVINLLRAELAMVMRQAGAPSIGKIQRAHVLRI